MFRHMFRGIIGGALVAVAALTAGGCATAPSRPPSPAESAFQDQSSWFIDPDIVDSNIVACVAGGVAGGALCVGLVALGANAGICAPLVLVGCGVAVGANELMQHLRKQGAEEEKRLTELVRLIREDNQHAAELVATSQKIIDEDLKGIAALEQAKAQGRESLDAKQGEVESLDARLAQLKDVVSGIDKKIAMYQEVSANGYPAAGPELQGLIENRNTLKKLLDELLRRRNVFAA